MNGEHSKCDKSEEQRCNWVEDSDGNWATACGNTFCLDPSEPPEAHGMKFCCYCGKSLASFSYKELEELDEDDIERVIEDDDFDPYEAAGESRFGLPGGGKSL